MWMTSAKEQVGKFFIEFFSILLENVYNLNVKSSCDIVIED